MVAMNITKRDEGMRTGVPTESHLSLKERKEKQQKRERGRESDDKL